MLKIDIYNELGESVPKFDHIRLYCHTVLSIIYDEKYSYAELEILFVSPQKIAFYNRRYLKSAGTTDIISFPNANLGIEPASLGTLMICPKYLRKYQEDMFDVISHGLLHLAGYDHESDQNLWNKQLSRLNYELSKV